jgi:hypothetical protein
MTEGTADYGIYIAGADTLAIYVASGGCRFDGNVAVGANTNSNYAFYHVESYGANPTSKITFNSDADAYRTVNSTNTWYGMYLTQTVTSSNSADWTAAIGIAGVRSFIETEAGSGTITGVSGFISACTNTSSMTISNRYGLYVYNAMGTGTITNQYGIYITDMTEGATLDYGIYIEGADTYALYIAADGAFFGGYVNLFVTDVDGSTEGDFWYDDSENKLKFYTGAAVETVTSSGFGWQSYEQPTLYYDIYNTPKTGLHPAEWIKRGLADDLLLGWGLKSYKWHVNDMAIIRVDHILESGYTHGLPYPFEQALKEAEYVKSLEGRIVQLESQIETLLAK